MKDMTVSQVKKALKAAFPNRTHCITVQDWYSIGVGVYKSFAITIFKAEYEQDHNIPQPCKQYNGNTLRETLDNLLKEELVAVAA